jgi:hypothetical protein
MYCPFISSKYCAKCCFSKTPSSRDSATMFLQDRNRSTTIRRTVSLALATPFPRSVPYESVSIQGFTPGSDKLMDRSAKYLKSLVGAPGFEPGASCAQGRRSTQDNCSFFNVAAETKQLSRDRSMWLAVRRCAHLSVGWAQKPAQSRPNTRPGSIRPSVQSIPLSGGLENRRRT